MRCMANARMSSSPSVLGSGVITWLTGRRVRSSPRPATRLRTSRSVKMPTSRPPSTTRTLPWLSACIFAMTPETGSAGATHRAGGGFSSTSGVSMMRRCRPDFWAGTTSTDLRSWPQCSQASMPAMLSWPQSGQFTRAPILRRADPATRSGHRPGRSRLEEPLEAPRPQLGGRLVRLALDQLFQPRAVGRVEDPHGNRVVGVVHARQQVGERRLLRALVMHQEPRLGGASRAERHHLGMQPLEPDPLVARLAEDQRLAVLEGDHPVAAHLARREGLEGAVVEDVAVLVDLHERGPL